MLAGAIVKTTGLNVNIFGIDGIRRWARSWAIDDAIVWHRQPIVALAIQRRRPSLQTIATAWSRSTIAGDATVTCTTKLRLLAKLRGWGVAMHVRHPGGRPSQADCDGHNWPMMPSDGIIVSPWPRVPANAVNAANLDILASRFGDRASEHRRAMPSRCRRRDGSETSVPFHLIKP